MSNPPAVSRRPLRYRTRIAAGLRLPCALAVAFATSLVTPAAGAAPDAPPAPPAPAPPEGVLAPRLIDGPSVAYPDGAAGDAVVLLTLTVGVDGSVHAATAAAPNLPFSALAEQAALAFRYEPATRAGKPVASRIRIEIAFHAPVTAPVAQALPAPAPPPPAAGKPVAEGAQDVTVRGAHVDPSRSVSLSRAEVRQIPGTFGDPFRALEIMPGVTPIVSGLPFFFVRGAPPGDVGYFLDGIRVPYLFHVGAGPSVVHPGLVDRVDLYPGGYPARFGRFSGGIVSGETLPPPAEARGELNVRLFDAGALVDAPFDKGRGEVLLGGRYSFTAAALSLLSPSTVLNYWDYQARVGYDLTPRDRVSVFAFGALDFLGQKTATDTTTLFGTQFHRVDARYDRRLAADGVMRTALMAGEDLTEISAGRQIRDRLVGLRTDVAWRLSPSALARAGTDVQVDAYDILLGPNDLSAAAAKIASLFPTRSDLTVGMRGDVVLKVTPAFEVTPGLRLDLYSSEGATAIGIDPRLSTRTAINKSARVLASMGLAHQPPSFVIPVPGFAPGGLSGGLQTAVQQSLGVEVDLGQSTTATATVFHNGFFNLSDALSVTQPVATGCPPGSFPDDSISGDRGTQPSGNARSCKPPFPAGTVGPDNTGGGGGQGNSQQASALSTRATGNAYGVELFLKRKLTSRVGGFLSYTLSRSTRTASGQEFIASFDRTHVLNAALAFDLGRNWRAGTRVTFYTGLPKAPDPTTNATRLDPFFRLDLRIEKRWNLAHGKWLSAVAEWMNATLSKESIGTSCTLGGCQETKVGPITIPSLGVEGGF